MSFWNPIQSGVHNLQIYASDGPFNYYLQKKSVRSMTEAFFFLQTHIHLPFGA
jgi:hypothetical protein